MMPTLELTLRYASREDLAAHLAEQPGALLLRVGNPQQLASYTELMLYLRTPDGAADAPAQLLQALDGLGLVVRLVDPASVRALVAGAGASAAPSGPQITGGAPPTEATIEPEPGDAEEAGEEREEKPKPVGAVVARGGTVLSWPIEKLQTEWHSLPPPDKIRVAKHGKRPARAFVMRMMDKKLHAFLLRNPKIGIDEIATLAGMVQLDPTLLRQIAMTPEWVRHSGVARALVTHPKLPVPLIQKILPSISVDEARRLTKSGRVRASVKRLLMKKIEKGR